MLDGIRMYLIDYATVQFISYTKELSMFTKGDQRYMNDKKMIPKCYVYGLERTRRCRLCHEQLKYVQIPYMKKNSAISRSYPAKYCEVCNMYYIQYSIYMTHPYAKWNLQNEADLLKYEKMIPVYYFENTERVVAKERKNENLVKKIPGGKKEDEDRIKKEKERKFQEFLKKREKRIELEKKKIENSISIRDFVIRTSTFKCMHEKHELKNIEGVIDILNKEGRIEKYEIPAGYCAECNLYFIMESTYEKVVKIGIPLCRITDEKAYMHEKLHLNKTKLAKESILMQYGYNVSKVGGLTEKRRRTILANLIDNDVLTKNEIISYIDFFINQKKNRSQYEKAIEKWENDRNFVCEYKRGQYTAYNVGVISNVKHIEL